jgi:hypothetical protein
VYSRSGPEQKQAAYFEDLQLSAAPPLVKAQQQRDREGSGKAGERRNKSHQYEEDDERRQAEQNIHAHAAIAQPSPYPRGVGDYSTVEMAAMGLPTLRWPLGVRSSRDGYLEIALALSFMGQQLICTVS